MKTFISVTMQWGHYEYEIWDVPILGKDLSLVLLYLVSPQKFKVKLKTVNQDYEYLKLMGTGCVDIKIEIL